MNKSIIFRERSRLVEMVDQDGKKRVNHCLRYGDNYLFEGHNHGEEFMSF